jgi:NAD(P)-dependent dehydrogenase (short-subunit alcohol dehydrogenase family)
LNSLEGLLKNGTTPDMPSRVINVASVAGLITTDPTAGDEGGLAAPGSGTYSYGPSKAACIHLSKQQASKLAPDNVMVNCIAPGVFPSRMTSYGVDKYLDTLIQGQPTRRIGKPTDFAGLVLFLSSRASAHITGNVIAIDGGSMNAGGRGRAKKQKL